MTSPARFRRTATLFVAAVIALAGLSVPAGAHALKGASKADRQAHARTHVEHGKARAGAAKARVAAKKDARKATARKAAARARREARKAARAARYVATGTLAAVDGSSFLVTVEGGNRKYLRGAGHVFTLTDDGRVNRDDVRVTLADLQPGDHVAVKGRRDGEILYASKVNASSPEVDDTVSPDPVVSDPTVTDP